MPLFTRVRGGLLDDLRLEHAGRRRESNFAQGRTGAGCDDGSHALVQGGTPELVGPSSKATHCQRRSQLSEGRRSLVPVRLRQRQNRFLTNKASVYNSTSSAPAFGGSTWPLERRGGGPVRLGGGVLASGGLTWPLGTLNRKYLELGITFLTF